ncbi:glutamine--fructose-6-phosphate transaminase (isomerizing) [Gilvimarinus agarilyticus]|uniref:glutamine--fructose-6-phosphate transaminase (isomerizing) n=1 Tax=unclassified Gilvimarinus TaxID=2642066 RepID=UPI001C0820FC|nr:MULTISPECIES: glutamine--fructose-6-phosphate transaminase (isomerizing) [unclassified Gilvimarinus]MBU2884190.1 glutamine--fructose-6-phosphate transaminase (isomerizing) [Gilvimarinus agarilyticus]MDO6569329.1 glutamine--fructose-6-phosphate transaminase (isomerizing) [Gilvimarinus sp. 2_MG-2023]MDO6747483.1 glutamine--fructose-6-phosphate transaminase (isomerizing) [Gilvimarinus sp. 1_MG-2023]
MCGIVGAIAQRDVAQILLEGLKRLEYRGYDSAGLAVINPENTIERIRALGKVQALADAMTNPIIGGTGIAHTRWATHGEPSENNAHPHTSSDNIALVHNGIIENHQELRQELVAEGYHFQSQTDTEVIAHLVHKEQQQRNDLLASVQAVTQKLRGAYGTVVMDKNTPEQLVVARSGSPLVIGLGIGENFVASDSLALLPVTRQFIYLEEGDVALITRDHVYIEDANGVEVDRPAQESTASYDAGNKGDFRHFMLKEIYDQPQAVRNALESRLAQDHVLEQAFGTEATKIFAQVRHVQIVACGTSYHSAMVARYWFESLAGIACSVEIASEYRYRKSVVPENSLLVTISQSGETADTLAALRMARHLGYLATLAICNVGASSLVRESDLAFMTRAGVEIGVASTKAFTTQLVGLAILVLSLAQHNQMNPEQLKQLVSALKNLPQKLEETLNLASSIETMAKEFADKHHTLFLGRGDQYPIAMEGALKLKEISYIHAEAYAAGELKHGPLALIDDDMPIVVVAPNNELLEKLKSNVEEVRARGGLLYVFADIDANFQSDDTMRVINLPHTDPWLAPVVYTIPLQLLSYYVAIIKGTDVDQPRNLAKSVTVE